MNDGIDMIDACGEDKWYIGGYLFFKSKQIDVNFMMDEVVVNLIDLFFGLLIIILEKDKNLFLIIRVINSLNSFNLFKINLWIFFKFEIYFIHL